MEETNLSKGGRLILLCSILANLLIYFMSMFTIPRIVKLGLEKVQRDFLWGGALEKKIHLVKWSIVCKTKSKGGLGIRSLLLLNNAFLCKWCWRFSSEKDLLWKKIIRGKFKEEEGGWRSGVVRDSYIVEVWEEIKKQWELIHSSGDQRLSGLRICGCNILLLRRILEDGGVSFKEMGGKGTSS